MESCLFDLLLTSRQIWADSDGAFDITAQALLKAWGFFRGPKRVPSEAELAAALACVGMCHVCLDERHRTVRFTRDGVAFNLGSIGKGHALDRMADRLRTRWNLTTALLHGGSSSVYAMGSPPDSQRGWLVQIRHPWVPARRLAGVWLRDRALGTSAATFQHLVHKGRRLGHVLDPRTGWPAAGIASASALAPTAALADALATAFYVGGLDYTRRYCAEHPEVGAILLAEGANEPELIGLSSDDLSRTE